MMLRYSKDRHTQEHIASTPTQEHECRTCGKPPLSRTGMKVHQRLIPQCAKNMTQEDQNNKACPNKNCNFRHPDTRQMQSHLFYLCREKNILHALNCLTTNKRKNRTKMRHTGAQRANKTCLQNNMTYNAGTQQSTCNIRNRTERPHDSKHDQTHTLAYKK